MARPVVSLAAERKRRAKTPVKRAQRRPEAIDARAGVTGRLFEITLHAVEGDAGFARRVRLRLLRPGGLVGSVEKIGPDQFVVGMLAVELGHRAWSDESYGGVPRAEIGMFREIVERVKPQPVRS